MLGSSGPQQRSEWRLLLALAPCWLWALTATLVKRYVPENESPKTFKVLDNVVMNFCSPSVPPFQKLHRDWFSLPYFFPPMLAQFAPSAENDLTLPSCHPLFLASRESPAIHGQVPCKGTEVKRVKKLSEPGHLDGSVG